MGWPLPLHVLIKITRECKTDFLNASCLFFSVFLAYLFLLLFLGGSRVGGGRYHNSCRVGEEGWLSVVVAVAFSTPQRARLFVFFGHLPPFSVALLLLGWVTWFGDREVHDGPVLG